MGRILLKLFPVFVTLFLGAAAYSQTNIKFANGNWLEYVHYEDDGVVTYAHASFHPKNTAGTERGRFEELIGTSLRLDTIDHLARTPDRKQLLIQTERGLYVLHQNGDLAAIPLPDVRFASEYGRNLKRRHWKFHLSTIQRDAKEELLLELPLESGQASEYFAIGANNEVAHLGRMKRKAFPSSGKIPVALAADSNPRLYLPSEINETQELSESVLKIPAGTPILENYHVSDAKLRALRGNPWYRDRKQYLEARELRRQYKTIQQMWEYRLQLSSFKYETYTEMLANLNQGIREYFAKYFPEIKVITETIGGKERLFFEFPPNQARALALETSGVERVLFDAKFLAENNTSGALAGVKLYAPLDFILNPNELNPTFSHEIRHGFLRKVKSSLGLSFLAKQGEFPGNPGAYEKFFFYEELDTYKITLLKLRKKLEIAESSGIELSIRKELWEVMEDKLKAYEEILPYFESNLAEFKKYVMSLPESEIKTNPFDWIRPGGLVVEVETYGGKQIKLSKSALLTEIANIELELEGAKKFAKKFRHWKTSVRNIFLRAINGCVRFFTEILR